MKKKTLEATRFPIKFTPVIILLCIAILLLCGGGIALSIFRLTRDGVHGVYDALKSPFLIAICVFGIAIVIAMLIDSHYVVNDTYFITKFGFVKSKFEIKKITAMIYDRDKQKVSVYFGEEFSVVSVSPEWVDSFVKAILAVKPEIDYSFTLSDTPDKEEKKNDKNDKKDQ